MGKRVKALMVLKGDSVSKLAKYLNISRQTLYNKMSGITKFTLEDIEMICKRYDTDPNYIFGF